MNKPNKLAWMYKFTLFSVSGEVLATWEDTNLIPDVGRDYIIANGISETDWYIGLFTANRTPLASDTLTSFLADCSESVAYATTNNSRLPLIGAVADGVYSNMLSPAVFTFSSNQNIYGAFVTNASLQGSTNGCLVSAEIRTTLKAVSSTDSLSVVCAIPVTSI